MRWFRLAASGACAVLGIMCLMIASGFSHAHDAVLRRVQHGESVAHSISPGVSHAVAVGGMVIGVLFVLPALYLAATAPRTPLVAVLLIAGTAIIIALAWLLHGIP
jgi:preprotein translocase subunit SecY